MSKINDMDYYLESISIFYDEKLKFLSTKDNFLKCKDCPTKKIFKEELNHTKNKIGNYDISTNTNELKQLNEQRIQSKLKCDGTTQTNLLNSSNIDVDNLDTNKLTILSNTNSEINYNVNNLELEVLINSNAALSCNPQSHRNEPNKSPVKH